MADDPIDLIRRFEPILHFHKDERFFPSDAKRYMEHCALWDVKGPPFDDKARWNGTSPRTLPHFPRIPRGKLVVLDGEKPVKLETTDGIPGKVLGEPGLVYLNLLDTAEDERFLDLAGWVDGYGVTRTSINRYTDLNEIADLYNRDNQALMDSRFWYHAELFNASRLRGLADASGGITLDKFTKLTDPALLCYYLFFPGHEEPLEGCNDDFGKNWASFAGAWGCVAVLLAGDGSRSNYTPKQIGLTSRNAGAIAFLAQEIRVGMMLADWNLVTRIPRNRSPNPVPGDHPRIFVSLGTHSLYRDPIGANSTQLFFGGLFISIVRSV